MTFFRTTLRSLSTIAIFHLALFSSAVHADVIELPDENLSFDEQIEFFSEEALGLRPENVGTMAIGSDGCEISDALAAQFDLLIPIDDDAKRDAEDEHAEYGLPKQIEDTGFEVLLHHHDYILGYNTSLRQPVFATYRLDREDIVSGDRRDCFREDHRLEQEARSTLADYDEPVFDRGHLVPVGDMHRKFSTSVNTFYLSNMMPQSASNNRGVWQYLEKSVRLWAARRGSVLIVAGPVFDEDEDGKPDAEEDVSRIQFEERVAQPTHFFKIIVDERSDGTLDTISFLIPHNFSSVGSSRPHLQRHIATIDEIEEVSGYDFFPDMEDAIEDELESSKADRYWRR